MTGKQHPPAGTIVRPAINGKTQVIRARRRWSREAERIFFEHLAATCNVCAAAAEAGFSTTAIYNRRMKWPGFAEAWVRAVEQGFARIEAQLIETASASLAGPSDFDGGREVERVSFADALNLYKLHRAEVRGGPPQRYDARSRPLDPDAVRASLLKKVEMIERGMARERDYAARADDAG
jgi:hypothetical protein